MKEKKIETLHQLRFVRDEKKAVICPKTICFNKPIPAAFVINMSGTILLSLFKSGMYVYQKPNQKERR